ncbi:UDP-glucuronic acid decarboxylase family protein [Brevibacillus thermoruber]|jgi:nucleoside-diphosphate-sugar epimerase|uniref:UDP-glucuronic acid decarboxylase family protein n=1 Tax=Brevibacillus thermoruber TaxID=33942 RepID=UPI004041AC9A
MKRVIITGAAGFLGSHLAKELVAKGCDVIGIDNLSTGLRANVRELEGKPNFRFVERDVTSIEPAIEPEFAGVTEIYHLASPASPKFYQASPLETIAANTLGTRNMLEVARCLQAKFLFASTSEVYGDADVHPQPEDYCGKINTWGPRACYYEAKRLGEVYCFEYYRIHQVRMRIARIFNTYSAGLRNDDGRVISNFLTQALNGEEITVYGDGQQTRCFCYVDDTVRGLQAMMESEAAEGQIFNIGNPADYTILEIAQLIKQMTASDSAITFCPLPADDPRQRCPSIEKAKQILGWEPKIDLEEGLRRTIAAYKRALAGETRDENG